MEQNKQGYYKRHNSSEVKPIQAGWLKRQLTKTTGC